MTLFNEKIIELEEVRNSYDLSIKRLENNERIMNELCDYYVDGSIANKYFSKKVAEHLTYSDFSSFNIVESDDVFYYISDYGDELSFTEYKGMSSITYKTADGEKNYKIYRAKNHAYVRSEDYSHVEEGIVSGELRVYNLNREPIFERAKKFIIRKKDDKKTTIVEKYGFKNNKLSIGIYSTTKIGDATMESKYDNVVDESRYEIRDGELYIFNENDSQVIEDNNILLKKLLKL